MKSSSAVAPLKKTKSKKPVNRTKKKVFGEPFGSANLYAVLPVIVTPRNSDPLLFLAIFRLFLENRDFQKKMCRKLYSDPGVTITGNTVPDERRMMNGD